MPLTDQIRDLFVRVLPAEEIEAKARELGVIKRVRSIDIVELVYAIVTAIGVTACASRADVLDAYVQAGNRQVARSSFYARFNKDLAELMKWIWERLMQYVDTLEPDLPGQLAGVSDWYIVDSTTCRLRDELFELYPGCGDYAAVKVHKTYSIGRCVPTSLLITAGRVHDTHGLSIDESWKGKGIVADLGYASIARIAACIEHDVALVIRLKDNWKVGITRIRRGRTRLGRLFEDEDLELLLDSEELVLDGKAIDADALLGARKLAVRVVGVPDPTGAYRWYITTLPPTIGPLQVAQIYRVRWEIECSFRLDKSERQLAEFTKQVTNPDALEAMIYASLISSTLSGCIVHLHNLEQARQSAKARRIRRDGPPLHVRRVAKALAIGQYRISQAMVIEREQGDATEQWELLTRGLVFSGEDPNYLSKPSALDELRGYGRKPKRRKTTRNKGKTGKTGKNA